ncbi:MAG TPA: dTDP-4-dehydrorhamnose reductase, partial [Cellvibrionaceae bacterium]
SKHCMDNPRLLVTGANGQLGRELAALAPSHPQFDWHFTGRAALDLTDSHAIAALVDELQPSIIINAAAYTAVDKAEAEPELAFAVNHHAVAALASAAARCNAGLIHISTDYVFDGSAQTPYRETDSTAPASVYGQSKLAGEQAFQASNARGVIVRTSWVYSAFGNNFVATMLRLGAEREQLGVVTDQSGSPTWAADLARALIQIAASEGLLNKRAEVYHYSNQGVCSWHEFATHIMAARQLPCRVDAITSKEYPTPAPRPAFSALATDKICRDFNLSIPHWQPSLLQALQAFV